MSEASRNFQDSSAKENKQLLRELTGVQQVSASAKQKLNGYVNEVTQNFSEDTLTYTGSRMTLETCLQEWYAICSYDTIFHLEGRRGGVECAISIFRKKRGAGLYKSKTTEGALEYFPK